MATETTSGTPAAADRSTELVTRLLKLPEEARLDLAHLLLDSVKRGFTSLEEAEARDKQLVRSRLDELTSGKAKLISAEDFLADLERPYQKGAAK
jgi:hypothetical protein